MYVYLYRNARCIMFELNPHLLPYLEFVNSEGSGKTAHYMCNLAGAFTVYLLDMYGDLHNLCFNIS